MFSTWDKEKAIINKLVSSFPYSLNVSNSMRVNLYNWNQNRMLKDMETFLDAEFETIKMTGHSESIMYNADKSSIRLVLIRDGIESTAVMYFNNFDDLVMFKLRFQ